jgi:intracellular septation protein A
MTPAVAVTLLICAAFLVSWLWRPRQATEPGVRLLIIAYALLGAWALWSGLYAAPGQESAEFRFLKPTVLYWTLAIILIVAPLLGWGYPVKAIFGTYFAFSKKQWRWMNQGFAALCTVLGGVNLLVAFNAAEGNWVGHKFSTLFVLLFLVLFRMSFIWVPTLVIISVKLYHRAKALFP